MKLSVRELLGYTIETIEGTKGNTLDFLFDENEWMLRYIEADFGHIFSRRKLLIPSVFLNGTDWESKRFIADVKDGDLKNCPEPNEMISISREYEKKLNGHFAIPDYWSRKFRPPNGRLDVTKTYVVPPEYVYMPGKMVNDSDLKSNLRSFKELLGYTINNKEGEIGELVDLIIDTDDWSLISFIVHILEQPNKGKDIIIASTFLKEINSLNKKIYCNLSNESFNSSVEYKSNQAVNEVLVKEVRDFKGRQV